MSPVILPENSFKLEHFRQIHFGKNEKSLNLKKGEMLLKQGEPNDRLFVVISGSLTGYVCDEDGNRNEVFRSEKDMFVGVRSSFSKELYSYADVVANENSKLVYVDINDLNAEQRHHLVTDFVPVLINELYIRQRFASRVMQERESALKKLMQTEKMATLGQLAAGLTHELNNAVGVLKNNSEWLGQESEKYLKAKEDETIIAVFKKGMDFGFQSSASAIREKKKRLEQKYHLKPFLAKNMAKLEMDPGELLSKMSLEELEAHVNRYMRVWQMGVSLHDIRIAGQHAAHVIQSVKQLAVSDHSRTQIDINESIVKALTLLKSLVRRVELVQEFDDLPLIDANQGELVQVWINIIKNGCESMLQSKTNNPVLVVKTRKQKRSALISITDNGPGIDDEEAERIFQPSYTTKKEGLSFGLGIGLSVVQRLVDNYGGKIKVNSTSDKTTFNISLPL